MENAEERKKMKKIEKEEQLKKKLEQTIEEKMAADSKTVEGESAVVKAEEAKLMSSPNNYSQTYLKKINTELNSIINYAKRFYDLNTNPCGKAGTIGKAKAEEMDY